MTLLITIVPSILILLYFFFSDRFKEPVQIVWEVFLWGIFICFPAGKLNSFMINNFSVTGDYTDLTYSFYGPAWTEEMLKFLVLYLVVLRKKEFNETMDGIVYGVVVSLGFATYENFSYVFDLAEYFQVSSREIAITRAFSAVPFHGLNGCIMGFFFGKYAFTSDKKYLIYSLIIPYFFHGSYNYVLTNFGTYFILLIMIVLALNLHSSLKKLQLKKKKENEKLKV
tara:strand:- start:475 stop:1152 length:678 start_codon:yes stop_codon:yes gene_type:complete